MTVSDFRKMMEQLKTKPAKLAKFIKHNSPKNRAHGYSTTKCKRCGRSGGHVGKYGLGLCRHCFRETATETGFKKFR
jgi:small subunit ribosomal protein S14